MPLAINSVIAGRPASVAGTLIIKFGRFTKLHRAFPSFIVAWVSWAKRGSTSILTRPSTPLVSEKIFENKSHAFRTSSVVSFLTISSGDCDFIAEISSA